MEKENHEDQCTYLKIILSTELVGFEHMYYRTVYPTTGIYNRDQPGHSKLNSNTIKGR